MQISEISGYTWTNKADYEMIKDVRRRNNANSLLHLRGILAKMKKIRSNIIIVNIT